MENVIIFSLGRDEAQSCSEMTRGSVADTGYVWLWQSLLKECVKRAATFICQDKVFLEGLKPFGRLEAINFSGFFPAFYCLALLIFPMCGYFLVKREIKGQISNVG